QGSISGMVNHMRHTRAHTANRRSHHALTGARLTVAKDGTVHPRHKALLNGAQYRGRSVMDLAAKRAARFRKAEKKRGSAAEARKDERKEEKAKEAKAEK